MFCVISLSSSRQWLTTYNFNPVFFELCRGALASSISWARYDFWHRSGSFSASCA